MSSSEGALSSVSQRKKGKKEKGEGEKRGKLAGFIQHQSLSGSEKAPGGGERK